ncbi:MAG: hypothetical protein WBM02_07660 [bacterium]
MPDIQMSVLIVAVIVSLLELYIHTGMQLSRQKRDRARELNSPESIHSFQGSSGLHPLQDEPIFSYGHSGIGIRKWIITHSDFDGFTSGALLLRLLGDQAGLRFSTPGSLLKTIVSAASDLIDGDSVFIADLPLQPHREHDFVDALTLIEKRGIKLIWIDHHEWPAGLIERIRPLCADLQIDSTVKTAAAIIRRMLPQDDIHADRLLRFVQNRCAEDDMDWDRNWRAALSELTYRRDFEMSESLLRIWAKDEPGGVLLSYLARRGFKRDQATLGIAAHKHRLETTAQDRSMLVIDVRSKRLEYDEKGRALFVIKGFQPSIMVGQHACRIQQGDFCIVLWENFRFSVYRGTDPELDFSALFGERMIEKASYRIGGHRYAVSVQVTPSLSARIKALFRWRPGPEAEAFIEYLKERY